MAKSKLTHLLLPEELKTTLATLAKSKGNSLSAEIRERLYWSLRKEAKRDGVR